MIKASNNNVEGYWPGLFAKALKGQDITALLSNVGSAPAAGGAAAATDAAPAEDKKEKGKSAFLTRYFIVIIAVNNWSVFVVCSEGRRTRRGHRYGRHVWRRRRVLNMYLQNSLWSRSENPVLTMRVRGVDSATSVIQANLVIDI